MAGMRVLAGDEAIQRPESGMVNILVKITINGQPTTLASSSSTKGFKFAVPEELLPETIVTSAGSRTNMPTLNGVVERAVLSDGSPLPSWLKYDAETNTFSAKEIPAGAKPVESKIKTKKNGQVLEESPPIVLDAK